MSTHPCPTSYCVPGDTEVNPSKLFTHLLLVKTLVKKGMIIVTHFTGEEAGKLNTLPETVY